MKFVLAILFVPLFVLSQEKYPQDAFQSPLAIPLDISGSFGELRSNHFHSGLDFKTSGVEGLPVYASADGYVSRIKISPFGYGKALYITHTNGYTSVYGHLQKANGAIQEFIKKKQYQEQSFEVEMYLYPSDLPVKKGDIIARFLRVRRFVPVNADARFCDSKTSSWGPPSAARPVEFGPRFRR
jgi:hypothetical protein